MALTFNKQKGAAQKSSVESIPFAFGENRIRLVGDILARYVYWIEGENKKNIPFECLSFDRDAEAFINKEKDWVKEFYPDLKCAWSYVMQGIDLNATEGPKVKVVNMKKKLWEQILTAAEDLGDPTDPDSGWDVVFEKKKTGPQNYNVEYTLKVLRCQARPMTDEEKEAIQDLKSMDDVIPRPTPDAQKALLDRLRQADVTVDEETVDDDFDIA